MELATVADIINDAAVELALAGTDIVDPFASTNPNIILLLRHLKRVGRSLVRARDWTHLVKESQLELEADTTSYTLPDDFARMVDETFWNRTSGNPVRPSLIGQDWQHMKARSAVGLTWIPFRIFQNSMVFQTAPAATDIIVFEYIGTSWVTPTGSLSPTKSALTDKADVPWFDESLLVAGLKLAFRRAKGMDTSSAQDEFNQTWSAVAGSDGAASAISLGGSGSKFPQMGRPPDTGWGL